MLQVTTMYLKEHLCCYVLQYVSWYFFAYIFSETLGNIFRFSPAIYFPSFCQYHNSTISTLYWILSTSSLYSPYDDGGSASWLEGRFTLWKFINFSNSQILREINFGEFADCSLERSVISLVLETSKIDFT